MGLDISAYKNLVKVNNPERDEYGELVNWSREWEPGASMEWSEKWFPGRGEGIDYKAVYTWDQEFSFRAGSYFGYGFWREKLSKFANDSDFHELINFADNEGVIGPIVSAKLADDFNKNINQAMSYSKTFADGEYWLNKYMNWKEAFEIASENGAINFR
ncbi:hypothetical protein [Bacillus sp. Marseille-P3800]|uniref:hypothetical protein n=1 Tax=Bacillus sp. Marseille-P3800 TaxID=2014782 RepID=UPI000C089589|nr:hypothetical protein [Bacillus sp. Marseille-P3800]